jgi:hypothetical protein
MNLIEIVPDLDVIAVPTACWSPSHINCMAIRPSEINKLDKSNEEAGV